MSNILETEQHNFRQRKIMKKRAGSREPGGCIGHTGETFFGYVGQA
jgi:hypothetical protein